MLAASIRGASALVLLLALAGCGGAAAQPSDASQGGADEASTGPAPGSPGAECLAIATAERERKPDEPVKITVKHILVKYAGAKGAAASITRTREQACLRALEARDKLAEGVDFDQAVADYSDEPGAASRGGTLGAVQREGLDPAFADAAFALAYDQVSHVVESAFGFHVILRTE